jgi:cyclopropane-fatty-acyl-phospholipid synthase
VQEFELFERFVRQGELSVIDHDGRRYQFGQGDPRATWRLNRPDVVANIVANPTLNLGETYLDGHWDVPQGTLRDLLTILRANLEDALADTGWFKAVRAAVHSWNNVRASYRNVSHHYDLDEELFRACLDTDLNYSCAYYERADMTLEEAQAAKCRMIAAKLRLEPELSVLDIGCGWGSLAIWLARHHDVNVTGLTLSREQLRVARARVKEAGLDHRVRLELMDYREHTGRYDRIVSVGMFEHVGKRNHVSYFRTAANCLAPDGVMVMHTIGNKLEPEPVNPWIRRHVFPGGYIPTISEVARAVEKVGFCTADLEIWRHHYALTLEAWNERFQAVREQFARLRGERFCRMWEFYLVSCQTAFEAGNLVVQQWQLTRDNLVVPITRDYLYARSDAQVVPPEGSARRPAARVVRPVSDKRVSGEPER